MSVVLTPSGAVSGAVWRPSPGAGGFFTFHGIWAPGVRLFRRLRFISKALLISLAFSGPLLGIIAWQLYSASYAAMQARMDATRQHVEVAVGVIAAAYTQETAGALSREQAQASARKTLAGLRYDKSEYFWVNDMTPRIVMHPIKPELDGQDVSQMKDPNGLALFSAFVAKVRQEGRGFVAYQWPKPGNEKPVDKISYVQGFEPWGWVVGSGVYVGDIQDALQRDLVRSALVVLVAFAVAGYLFLSFYKVMDGGLKETRRHLRAMTDGDLTTSPAPWGKDEAAQLMHDLKSMQEALRQIVTRVRTSSDQIVHSSTEIAHGAVDLSSRTEQAAANLEESAASMDELSATVRSTSDNTEQAAREARRNAEFAAQGGQAMREVVTTMDAIRGSSSQIAEIIGTIDGIAFQTNILSLNAAVEAARAGEQGRGFAVVASEVRMLAQRSAAAAKEISGLINDSVHQVKTGTEVVVKAGRTIEEMVDSSQRVDRLLSEIAISAREQKDGIAQVGQAVQELDRMTQQNAALVEETAAAAASLRDQAGVLADQVSQFVLP